jgi:cytochrome c553
MFCNSLKTLQFGVQYVNNTKEKSMKILISAVLALFLVGCSSESKQEAKETVTQTKESVTQSVKEVKSDVVQKAEEIKSDAVQKAEEIKSDVSSKVEDVKEDVVAKAEAAQEVVAAKVEEVKKDVATKVEDVKQAVSPQATASTLYQPCAGCHGIDASKAALGKSQIIKGWDVKKTADALHGYKAGTYGGAMKGLMTGQTSKLSDEDIKILSEYISKL